LSYTQEVPEAGGLAVLTVTLVEDCVVPPAPEHDSVYVVVAVGDTVLVPLSGSGPVAPPLAVHESAFWLDQVNVDFAPAVMVLGLAVKVTVGAGVGADVSTVIFVEASAVPVAPLVPLHESA
jgi:hypothetical protein